MTPRRHRSGPALALALTLLAGCDPNPDGPRVPSHAPSASPADTTPTRKPLTKNPREIINPE